MAKLITLLETVTAKRIVQFIKEKNSTLTDEELATVLHGIEFMELEDWFSTSKITIGLQFTPEEYLQLMDLTSELYEFMKGHYKKLYKTEHELLQTIFTGHTIYEMVVIVWYEEVFNPLYQNRLRILPAVLKEYSIKN
jgi:hypothetical protein